MRDHVSGYGTTLSVLGRPDHSRAARRKEEKEREKEKAKDDPKGPEEHPLAMNRYKIPNGSRKRTLLGGPKERKARRACRKAMMFFRRVVVAFTSPTKVQARTLTKTKAEERITRKRQRRNLSSIRIVSLGNTQ